MDNRGQFTFYRSFWEAVKGLPKKDRLPILEAIIEYALDGTSPSGLSKSQSAFFLLVKPNLDASRKKAASGKRGGSKPKANGKQTETKKELEIEDEVEIEVESEIEYECNKHDDGDAESAPARYADEKTLSGIGLKAGEYPCVTVETASEVKRMAADLINRYAPARRCTTADCRKVFISVCRTVGRSTIIDTAAAGLLEYAFETASLAGNSGNWFYIDGILARCNDRGILTEQMAREWDLDRQDINPEVMV